MWICGFLGMATKYSEALLGVKYRQHYPDGAIAGGPMYYIRNGIRAKRFGAFLAGAFAVCGAFAALFGTGNMMQANQMTLAMNSELGIPKIATAVVITVLTAMVILGGIKRIGSVTEKIVPTMILLYFGTGIVVLILNIKAIPAAFGLIFQFAFTPDGRGRRVPGRLRPAGHADGGPPRSAVQRGRPRLGPDRPRRRPDAVARPSRPDRARRGLHRHHPRLHAVRPDQPHFGTLDGRAQRFGPDGGLLFQVHSGRGGIIVALSSFLFGYSTLIGWCYYGEQCVRYLFGNRSTRPYRLVFTALVFVGAMVSLELVFYLGDIANAFMAFPNLIALVALSGVVAKTTKSFFKEYPTLRDFDEARK